MDGNGVLHPRGNFGCTVEPRLSNSCLSIPSIIWNEVQKFLKQVIPNC